MQCLHLQWIFNLKIWLVIRTMRTLFIVCSGLKPKPWIQVFLATCAIRCWTMPFRDTPPIKMISCCSRWLSFYCGTQTKIFRRIIHFSESIKCKCMLVNDRRIFLFQVEYPFKCPLRSYTVTSYSCYSYLWSFILHIMP